MALGL